MESTGVGTDSGVGHVVHPEEGLWTLKGDPAAEPGAVVAVRFVDGKPVVAPAH